MLSKLFGSNTRVKILKLFLLHPGKKFYIRQMARDLKLQVNSVRRELENLEDFGLLISNLSSEEEDSFKVGEVGAIDQEVVVSEKSNGGKQEKKYYQTNSDFVLLDELKALIVKAQVLHKEELIEKIKKAGKIKFLLLTGVFVNRQNSSVDILIVGRFERKEKVCRVLNNIEKEMGKELNYTIMDPREFKYRRDMTDVFLYGILEGKKIIVVDEYGVGGGQG